MKQYTLHTGDNREVLKTFDDNSVDSIVTDPPYELGFMGKKWDASGIAYNVNLWKECLRVLKPGGHLLAFGGSRTYHRMTVAIEDAGFEIRDCIMWLYASGFPKSHDVSKALDKQAGAEREVITEYSGASNIGKNSTNSYITTITGKSTTVQITAPATDLAKQWQGWGTALKPAHEPIVVARKPLQGTVADNVTAWGVGALNIDGCRVGGDVMNNLSGLQRYRDFSDKHTGQNRPRKNNITNQAIGRWPANIIFDEEAAQMLDEQSGGASRFFYVAKASKAEREAGLDGMKTYTASERTGRTEGSAGLVMEGGKANPYAGNTSESHRANHHPTVKPIALMRYLVRMVTPRGGVVLDPFMGSGTTGCAAMLEGVRFIGIELNEEYSGIAERRIRYWLSTNMAKQL